MNKPIKIWKLPEGDKRYIIGVDPAIGNPEGDDSAIEIIEEESGEQCAELSASVTPKDIASIAMDLGKLYNEALLAVEVNSFGIQTNSLILNAGYPNPYTVKRFDRLKREEVFLSGYLTTARTYELMLSTTEDYFAKYKERIRSKKLLAEWYALQSKDCKFDHRISAMMIALTVRAKRIHAEVVA